MARRESRPRVQPHAPALVPLCAIAAHALARELAGSDLAGLAAGLTFGFNPYRIAHLEHLELLAAWWLPLALLALHRYVREGRGRWLAIFAAAMALQGLSCGYYFIFAGPLVALWIVWFARRPRQWLVIGAALGATVVLLLPVFLAYRHVLAGLGLRRDFGEIVGLSADISGLASTSPLAAVWRSIPALWRPEGALFPGVFAPAAVIWALLVVQRPGGPRPAVLRHLQTLLLLAAIGLSGVALSTLISEWRIRIAGFTVAAAHNPPKPAALAVLCLLLAGAASPRFADTPSDGARRSRSTPARRS